MTPNTQSTAPGVAATVEKLTEMMKQYRYQGVNALDASLAEFQAALRTALQASAAAVETVPKEDYEGVMRMLAEQRATNARVAELIFQNDRVEAVKWAKGLTTDGALCWVEAPPLPAQVQKAEVSGWSHWEARIKVLMEQMGMPESRSAYQALSQLCNEMAQAASRTPASGMADPAPKINCMSKWPFPIVEDHEPELSDEILAAIEKGGGRTLVSQESRIRLMREAIAADRALRGAPGMTGYVGAINDLDCGTLRLVLSKCGPAGPGSLPVADMERVDALLQKLTSLAAPHPSPAPQAAGADTKRLNFLSQRGGMIITSDDENNRWHVEVLGGTDSEGEQIVTVYEGVTLRMAIDAAYEGVTGAAITASGRDAS